jgi:hypothetical protein
MINFIDSEIEEFPSSDTILGDKRSFDISFLKPDRRPIYVWAEENIILPQTYAVPGAFRVSPWMRKIFDCIQSGYVREVWLQAAIQSGKTLISDIAIPWALVNSPGPTMLTMQTEADMKEHMKTRLWPVFRSCRPLMDLMPDDRHDRSTQEVYFGSHFFIANGANINALQSKSIQWKFNDELWLPQWQPLYIHAKGRVSAFENVGASKIINVSQSGNVGDIMDRGYKSGTSRVWMVDGEPLEFFAKREDGSRFGIVWNDDAKNKDGSWNKARAVETCRYVTKAGIEFPDNTKTRKHWMEDGEWSEPVDGSLRSIESFHFHSLPTRPMHLLVAEWCDAFESARRGDLGPTADFTRKRRAVPWEDRSETVHIRTGKSGYKLEDVWDGEPIDGEVARFLTADRQKGMRGDTPHWWITAHAWRANGSSRILYAGRMETVESIESVRERLNIDPRCVLQDAGHDPNSVYNDCVRFGWSCAFGSERRGWEHIAGMGKKVIRPYSPLKPVQQGKNRVFTMEFSTDYHKDILSNLVQGAGAGWEIPDDITPEYFLHMEAESKVEISPGKWKWKSQYSTKPNHLWDCEVMQVVLAVIRGLLASPSPSGLDTERI